MQSLESSECEAGNGRQRYARRVLVVVLGLSVAAAASYLFFHRLGDAPLTGDEAIHAQVARQSATAQSWLPLRFDRAIYTAKPPLKILAVAWIFRYLGVSELHARAIDAALGVGTVLLVFAFGARRFGPWAGALAALLLATSLDYVTRHGVRVGAQDSALVFFLTAGGMLYARHLETGRSRRLLLMGAGVAVGLATLVKGLVAFLALPVLAAWEVARALQRGDGRPGGWRPAARDLGVMALLAVGLYLPWVLALATWTADGPRDLGSIFYRDVVVRATEAIDPDHVHGPAFYLRQLWSAYGVWLLAALPGLAVVVRGRDDGGGRERGTLLRCGLWTITLLAVLSLSTSKLTWYLYPAYPALVLFLAGGVGIAVRWAARRGPGGPAGRRALAGALVALALAGTWQRFDRLRDRVSEDPSDLRLARIVRAIEETPNHRVAVLREAPTQPHQLFYLWPLSWRSRGVPGRFRTEEPEGCRYLVQGRPEIPPIAQPAPHARALPLEWPEPDTWLVDLDGCLPSWV